MCAKTDTINHASLISTRPLDHESIWHNKELGTLKNLGKFEWDESESLLKKMTKLRLIKVGQTKGVVWITIELGEIKSNQKIAA